MPTSFESIVIQLMGQIPWNGKVLDVGAGGFQGDTTTQFLVKYLPYDVRILALERDYERCAVLRDRFKGRVNVVPGDFFKYDYETGDVFDLLVIDLDFHLVPRAFEAVLRGKVHDLVAPKGYVVFLNICHYENAAMRFDLKEHNVIRDFMDSVWGKRVVSTEEVMDTFRDSLNWEPVMVVDKRPDDNCVQWIVLRKK